jgi:hypothetical protein
MTNTQLMRDPEAIKPLAKELPPCLLAETEPGPEGLARNLACHEVLVNLGGLMVVPLWRSSLFWAAWCLPASLLGWPRVGNRAISWQALIYGAYACQLPLFTRRGGPFALDQPDVSRAGGLLSWSGSAGDPQPGAGAGVLERANLPHPLI